jgi:4-hydroxy-2-oxoheptanedioate aldolase
VPGAGEEDGVEERRGDGREETVRTNILKRKLAEGKRVCGAMVEFDCPELIEILGHLGYDFVFLDGQHCGLNPERARGLIRAADLVGMTSVVRVPKNDPAIILDYLELGAGGIIVPNVTTRAETEAMVAALKYPPAGIRGGFGRSRASNYGITQTQVEYFTKANDEVLAIPLVEDRAALPNLDAICSAPGVDMVITGPGDMALSMGIPGGWKDPRVQAAVATVQAAATAAGKPAMIVALDPADGQALYAQGFRALLVSAGAVFTGAAKNFLQQIGRD